MDFLLLPLELFGNGSVKIDQHLLLLPYKDLKSVLITSPLTVQKGHVDPSTLFWPKCLKSLIKIKSTTIRASL